MIVTSPRHPTSFAMIGGFLWGFTQLVVADGYGTNEAEGVLSRSMAFPCTTSCMERVHPWC